MENNVQGLLGISIEKIKEMVDVNTVIGEPITTPDGTTLIPVSKVAIGFASGGSDLPSKSNADLFGGGSGAGINITPIAFIAIANGDVRILQLVAKPDTGDRLVNLIPDVVDTISGLFKKDKDKKETEVNDTVIIKSE